MARRKASEAPATAEVESTEENTVSTETTEAPVEATDTTETEVEFDLTDFEAALAEAVAERDTSTGDVPEASLAKVVTAYRQVKGAKGKNAAKKVVDEAMRAAMGDADLPLAKANLEISGKLTAGPVSSGRTATPKEPVDPTEAFVERVAGLRLASVLADTQAPEGVAEDWAERAATKANESVEAAQAYLAWLTNEDEDKGDAPEVEQYVAAAAKLALGKSAKVGLVRKSSGGGGGFDGPRRSVEAHIQSAFANLDSGAFLSIADIRNHESDEYGKDHPSAGAISARLFPKSGNVTIEGVKPDTQDGKKGAVKV